MKIGIIHPSTPNTDYEKSYTSMGSPGTDIQVLYATGGAFTTAADVDLKGPECSLLARQAEATGFDALIIAGMCDFSIYAIRGAVRIPVIGAASATYMLVSQFVRRFGVISFNTRWNPAFYRVLRECNCIDRMTSMRTLKKPLLVKKEGITSEYTPEQYEEEILKVGREQVNNEGAQCIVVSCLPVFSLCCPPGAQERLERELGVIVPDPQKIAVQTAEAVVRTGLTHSELEYPYVESASLEDRYEITSEGFRIVA